MKPRHPEISVQLTGEDGNAHSILGRVTRALKEERIPPEEVQLFIKCATSGDYDHLLQTCMEWVEVT